MSDPLDAAARAIVKARGMTWTGATHFAADRDQLFKEASAAIEAYLRVEAKSYPRMLPATSFRHPGFLLHELANKAAGLKDDEDEA